MSNWEKVKIKDVCNIVNGGTPKTSVEEYWNSEDVVWITPTDITQLNSKYISDSSRKISTKGLSESSATLLPVGSVLMCSRATIGPCAINTIPVSTNQGFKSFICSERINNEYLYYLISILKEYFIDNASGSTFLEVSKSVVENCELLLPPLKEQQKIAEILSSVDAAIAKTEQVIAKTEEVKKGLMQQLLTKGIGHTEFKQTEIGEIPTEWEVKSGEELFRIVSGYSPSAVTDLIENGSILFLKVNDFNNNRMYIKQSALYFEEDNNPKIKYYNPGTIIFPKRGAAIFTNKIAILSKKAAFDTNIMGLECNHLINNQFLYFYLKNYELSNISDNSGVPQLNNKHINPLLIPVPSLNEQIKIVENIQCFEMKLEKELLYLEQLVKIKQGLMQQLLTGQVRVKID